MSSLDDIITFFKDKLAGNGLNVAKIVLFGSHANGNADKESDLDLVVISGDFQNKNIFERVNLIGDARASVVKNFKVPVDILLMTPEEFENEKSPVADECRDGIVVYAA